MTDLLLTPDGDLERLANDRAADPGRWSAVVVSVLADRRVDLEDAPDGSVRGWWGEEPGDPPGSRLWTPARERQPDPRPPALEAIVQASPARPLAHAVAASVDVPAPYPPRQPVPITAPSRRGAPPPSPAVCPPAPAARTCPRVWGGVMYASRKNSAPIAMLKM